MKFSTFHAFMLADAKVGEAVTEGPGFNTSPAKAIQDERELIEYADAADWDDRWIAGDVERVVSGIQALERMGYANLCVIFGLDAAPAPVPEIK